MSDLENKTYPKTPAAVGPVRLHANALHMLIMSHIAAVFPCSSIGLIYLFGFCLFIWLFVFISIVWEWLREGGGCLG